MQKPIMIQDDFMGDFYLGCPKCKEVIHFPLINPTQNKPKKCYKSMKNYLESLRRHKS